MDQQVYTDTEQLQSPLHRRIAERLGQQVSTGQIRPGDKLPSERQIARQFNASRATVRTALQHLEQAGLISRRERRSAIVNIRRDITPSLRIACTSTRLTNLFTRLSDMQLLPPRCQIQQFSLNQPGAMTQLLTQPTVGVDMLICDLEFLGCFAGRAGQMSFPDWLIEKDLLFGPARNLTAEADGYLAVPLALSPVMLYYNRSAFRTAQLAIPNKDTGWPELGRIAESLKKNGKYGLQFRPSFTHLAAMFAGQGCDLYQDDGTVAANTSMGFEPALRFVHELLHARRCSPRLARADEINLFAENRCAMAVDGFDMLDLYQQRLGPDLGVTALPENGATGPVLSGCAAVVLAQEKELQPMRDLLRVLVTTNSQRMITQLSAGLPVRNDLLTIEMLRPLEIAPDVAAAYLNALQRCGVANLPGTPDHKCAVESLTLEMWLGLDTIDSICQRFRSLT